MRLLYHCVSRIITLTLLSKYIIIDNKLGNVRLVSAFTGRKLKKERRKVKKSLFSIIVVVVSIIGAVASILLDNYPWYWPFLVFAVLFFAFYLTELLAEESNRIPFIQSGTVFLIAGLYFIISCIVLAYGFEPTGLLCALVSFIAFAISLIGENPKTTLAVICIINTGCFIGGLMASLH